jgi:hypothetical protein
MEVLPPEEDEGTGASVQSITDFDIASTISQRALQTVEPKPADLWEGGHQSVADVEPNHIDLSAELDPETGARRESELGPEIEEKTPEKPHYYTRPGSAPLSPEQVSRRKLLRNAALAVSGAVVGWNVFRRRPMPALDLAVKPAAITPIDFATLQWAFEAILGDPTAAARAASEADLRMQRLGPGPSERLARNLGRLEMGATGMIDGRRFTRLDLEEAREVLDAWGRSSLPTRRRIRAELEHLARWGWASHPSTRAEFGLDGPA